MLYSGFPLSLLTLLTLLTSHFPYFNHAQKNKKVVDYLKERLRETKTVKFLVLLYLLCLLYSYTKKEKVVDDPNERLGETKRLSCFTHTVPLYFTTLTLLLLYLLYGKVVDYLKERLRETKTVKFFDNRYSIYLFYWYKSTNTDTALSIYLLYWYKSANTGAAGGDRTFVKEKFYQCTSFTGTKVQILTLFFFRTRRQDVLSLLAFRVQKYKY